MTLIEKFIKQKPAYIAMIPWTKLPVVAQPNLYWMNIERFLKRVLQLLLSNVFW